MAITQVHRVYDKRPDVFKYVAISDDFRERPSAVLDAPEIPKLQALIRADGYTFRVIGNFAQRTPHPLIWEVSLEVEEIDFSAPEFYGSVGSLVASRSTSPE